MLLSRERKNLVLGRFVEMSEGRGQSPLFPEKRVSALEIRAVVVGAPDALLMDLSRLTEDALGRRPTKIPWS